MYTVTNWNIIIELYFLYFLKDKLRLKRLKQHLNFDETKVSEEEWCSFHNLVQPSLNHVAEICKALTISFLYAILIRIYLMEILLQMKKF